MPDLRDPQPQDERADLERRLSRLELEIESIRLVPFFTSDGSRTLNGPFTHTGELLGFFGKAPERRSDPVPAVITGSPEADAINELIATLQRYGLLP